VSDHIPEDAIECLLKSFLGIDSGDHSSGVAFMDNRRRDNLEHDRISYPSSCCPCLLDVMSYGVIRYGNAEFLKESISFIL